MNANIMNMQLFFYKIKVDLKGQIRPFLCYGEVALKCQIFQTN